VLIWTYEMSLWVAVRICANFPWKTGWKLWTRGRGYWFSTAMREKCSQLTWNVSWSSLSARVLWISCTVFYQFQTASKWIFYLSSRYYCLSATVNSRWTVSKTFILITHIGIYCTRRYNEWDLYSVMFDSFVDVNNMSTKTNKYNGWFINQHVGI